jgi:hypothetical protein
MQRNRQKDQKCYMNGGGGAPRVPSSRGESLESWCAWQSYKASKLQFVGGRPADEQPFDRA